MNVVIAGCGVIGRAHATALQEFDDVSIVGLVDPVAAAAESMAAAIEDAGLARPRTFTSFEDAFEAGEVDLVALATPSGLHVEQGLDVLGAGKHLVIEKPLDVDLARAREFEAAVREAGGRGQVASVISQHRFDPASVAVARAVKEKRFGLLTSAIASVAWWRSQEYYDSAAWRGTWSMDGGGALMNQGVHAVDLLLWFMGRPVEICARTARLAHERIEVEDTAVATIAFEDGGLALLHATTAAYPGMSVRLQLMGSAGSAVLDNDRLEYFYAKDKAPAPSETQAACELAKSPVEDMSGKDHAVFPAGHVRQYADILAAVRDGRQPGVTVKQAVDALAAVRAVYISATLNHPVLFDDVLAGKYDAVDVRNVTNGVVRTASHGS
ncbi:Gfo/Idh/MocA family protein [Arthrobacter nitrophenolicus]|uniref:Gfo/Idh/MocA family oxidoreductase n=1 Tax=Arthrobacter nitrophenolicus TaxID=683150 RepID=A0A4R5Y8Q7_9MICC|nr:Gfo/Idh/MocA family oxidoreductase [Arthrobacter nitrophenolicus]TDL39705.1 Gfo/Idh/MocA family oxidoreductase [Arthrobacter nitrophenolicus]